MVAMTAPGRMLLLIIASLSITHGLEVDKMLKDKMAGDMGEWYRELGEDRQLRDRVRFSPEQKHRELLESVIEFGLNQSQYLQQVQEKDLWRKGMSLTKKQPAHFVSVFNKQQKKAKMLSRYAYATLQASSLLSKQFMLTRQQV